jgi:hypothetical protein
MERLEMFVLNRASFKILVPTHFYPSRGHILFHEGILYFLLARVHSSAAVILWISTVERAKKPVTSETLFISSSM